MENHIKIQKTARYYTWGNINEGTEVLWVICHGYGQLAQYFIKKFEVLNPEKHFVVAPEGLSKFYSGGMTGRVGATWMTKEDRLNEIDDYLHYLDAVFEQVSQKLGERNLPKINLLGFSQGSATINRWAVHKEIDFNSLFIWAGTFPHDLDFDRATSLYQDKKVYLIYGDKDEFFKEENFQDHLKTINEKGIFPEVVKFKGTHQVDSNILLEILG